MGKFDLQKQIFFEQHVKFSQTEISRMAIRLPIVKERMQVAQDIFLITLQWEMAPTISCCCSASPILLSAGLLKTEDAFGPR